MTIQLHKLRLLIENASVDDGELVADELAVEVRHVQGSWKRAEMKPGI